MKKKTKVKKILKSMWFFHSIPMMIYSIGGILIFLCVNLVIFFHNYNFWIRSYQFALSLTFLAACTSIIVYWKRGRIIITSEKDREGFKLITAPIIVMTFFMALGSIFGYLHFIYFESVFRDCDLAIAAKEVWQTVSDLFFFITLIVTFIIYPIFIFQCYLNPLKHRWRWLFYFVTSTLVILFFHISLEEAYHTYAHLCDNQYVEENNLCPTIIEKKHYSCNEREFSAVQKLWVDMNEQVMGPGIFLVVAEYIPLLFVLIWMAPVRNEKDKVRSSIKVFKDHHESDVTPSTDTSLSTNRIVSSKELWAEADGTHRVLGTPENKPLSKIKTICVSVTCIACFAIMFLRVGLLLNHVGRYPRQEILWETIGHFVSALSLCAMFILAYFLWLRKHNTKLHKPGKHDPHSEHHVAHARFDAFLLKVASGIISIQIIVAGVVELDFSTWKTAWFLIHKIPVIAGVWLQYVALKKALTLECDHWQVAGKKCALILAVTAVNINFFEWMCQFIKRRFTVFILDEPDSQITNIVVAAISISEMLYPALSFYFFHALLCWMVVSWRIFKAEEAIHIDVDVGDETDAGVQDHRNSMEWKRRSELEDIKKFLDHA